MALAGFVLAAVPLRAQEVTPEIRHGSDPLDVPYMASNNAVLDAMFDFARPLAGDYVMDLGSGDGRIVIEAARRFGASGHGIDLNAGLVRIANERAGQLGLADRARFYVRDLFKEDLSRATIVTLYLFPEIMLQLRPTLFRALRPGARIVSHAYHMGDWRFDAARAVDAGTGGKQEFVYYWKVPARVAGLWDWTLDFPVGLDGPRHYRGQIVQHWQDIEGRVDDDLLPMRLHDAGLDGTTIRFSVTGELGRRSLRQDYVGTVAGNRVEGHVTLRGPIQPTRFPWSAQRRRADN